MIVADTGPLIAFARIGRLDLLQQVAGELVIPEAVYAEMTKVRDRPGAADIERGVWIRRQAVRNLAAVAQLPPTLHRGERHAMILAEELNARLLIDEQCGRDIATTRGLEVVGSLRVLADAKRQGLIEQTKPLVNAMLTAGYWIDEELVQSFLRDVGEAS